MTNPTELLAEANNTDREIWRGPDEGNGNYYADSIHVTEGGGIGINVGGRVIVKPLRDWHALARPTPPSDVGGRSDMAKLAIERVQSAYDDLCVRFSGVHSDDDMDSVLLRLCAALMALRQSPSPDEQKLGSSEPLGPLYDGTTMDNQQLHGTTRRNQPVVTAGETATAPSPAQQDGREAIARIIAEKTSCGASWDSWTSDEQQMFLGAADAILAILSRSPAPGGGVDRAAVITAGARVRQSKVYAGTRDGTVTRSDATEFTVVWDGVTVACTYDVAYLGDVDCPIRILAPEKKA